MILLAHSADTYLGQPGQTDLFAELDRRHAVVLVHPGPLPGPAVPGIPPLAADFLLDTTRAAYLLVRNEVVAKYPDIRFVLSHAGGFLPYAADRMALVIARDTGLDPTVVRNQFRNLYFDTALSTGGRSDAARAACLRQARGPHGVRLRLALRLLGRGGPISTDALDHYPGLDEAQSASHRPRQRRCTVLAVSALLTYPHLLGRGLGESFPAQTARCRPRSTSRTNRGGCPKFRGTSVAAR